MTENQPQPNRSFEQTDLFVRLFTAHQQRIYLFILALVSNPADAQDVLQETNLVLWRKFDQYQPELDFRAWAYQIARLEVLKFRERRGRGPLCLQFSDELLDQLTAAVIDQSDTLDSRRTALTACLQKLSARDRDLVERRAMPGATIASVATTVGRPVQGLYKAYQRIYSSLAECINRTLAREKRS